MNNQEIKIAIVQAVNDSKERNKYATSKQVCEDNNLDHETVVAAMKVLCTKRVLAPNMHQYFQDGLHVHLAETGDLFYEFFDNPKMFDEKPAMSQHIGDVITTNQGNESQSIVKSAYNTNSTPKDSWMKNNIIPLLILVCGIITILLTIYYRN